MKQPQYNITFAGELQPGMLPDVVKDNLARLFRSDRQKVEHMFGRGSIVLKRGLGAAEADRYLDVLAKAGAKARKELIPDTLALLDESKPASAPLPPAAEAGMECPKCGHSQPLSAECSACGIIIEKYLARQASLDKPFPTPKHLPGTPFSAYLPPGATLEEQIPQYGTLHVFSTQGRIGRLRYLAWSTVLLLSALPLMAIAGLLIDTSKLVGFTLLLVAVLGLVIVSIQITVQRLHDLGWSGWLYLLNFVPFIGSLFPFVLMLLPGNVDSNRYGLPQPPNSRAVKILAGASLIIPVIGVLLAVLIPTYQHDSISLTP